ncbi:MAG: helix-turn-helix domain-containing protein [Clostridiales bacterium]|nr:helix-turn-helix domain-containing protein [Clostridiales bacterium]
MEEDRKLMQFHFISNAEISTHYHQNLDLFYVMTGRLKVVIDDQTYYLHQGDIILINANKRHYMDGDEELLGARFEIDFHLLAEQMGSMQLLFWCNTVADRNEAYEDLRNILDRILEHYFEKNGMGGLHLNALYYEALYVLTSNFLIKVDDSRVNTKDTQEQSRMWQIQNYIQANYQKQISLNELAEKLYLSNAYLSKYIKKNFGMTFMEYQNNVRIFHAVDELIHTNKNMTRIAMDNGFPSSAAFTKAFRNMYGEAPSDYHRKMQEEREPAKAAELTQREEKIIARYLKYKADKREKEASYGSICTVDASQKGSRLAVNTRAICVGEAYSILHNDVQNQLIQLQGEAGIRYVRIWGMFALDECVNKNGECNFRKLDTVLDFLVKNHMKPYMDLGYKKTAFMYTPERYLKEVVHQGSFGEAVFTKVMKEFSLHLANRYGAEELESWYFEYWDESRSEDNGVNDSERERKCKAEEYFRNFEIIHQAMKRVSSNIPVGGAGFVLGYELQEYKNILSLWKESEIQPDFLSFYSYQYTAIEEEGKKYRRKSIDTSYMKNQILLLRRFMEEEGISVPELHISEWNSTISNRNLFNDSCEQGAYVLKNCIEMNGEVDIMAYWHALDSYSDYYDSNRILSGDSGLITRDGIHKPSYYAFVFMNRLRPHVLSKDEHAIVTTNGRGRFVIACHNYKKLSSYYVLKEENEIKMNELENYLEDSEPYNLKIRLENVQNGTYLVKIHYVNKEHGSVQDIWGNMECQKSLADDEDEMNYLKSTAIPHIEMKSVVVDHGVLEIENIMQSQEIHLLDIKYQDI